MKNLYQLWVLLGISGAMCLISYLLDRHFKAPKDTDVYTLSDANGNRVEILVKKQATAEEREEILAEKLRELFQQRSG